MKGRKDLIDPQDYGYMAQKPYGDPDFDPEHNRKVIEETIAWTDRMTRQKEREHQEAVKERTVAAATWLKSGKSDLKKYFGPKELARLRGEEVLAELKRKLKANPTLLEKARRKTLWRGANEVA